MVSVCVCVLGASVLVLEGETEVFYHVFPHLVNLWWSDGKRSLSSSCDQGFPPPLMGPRL